MVNIIGIDKFLDVSKVYGGYTIYIPNYSSIIRKDRDREILSKYDGYNGQELANNYGIGIWHIYCLVKKNADDKSNQ